MQERDKERFAQIMTGLAENFGSSLSKPGLSMRFEALKEYSIEDVEKAAFGLMRSRKYTTMPTVAEFLDHLGGGSVEDLAQVEATKVLNAIKRHGPYESVVFDDATTQAVVEHGFGGWQKLNDELRADQEKWFIKDFSRMYQAYSRQGVKHHGVLPGIVQHQNQCLGRGKIPDPIMIGDKKKAQQVAISGRTAPTQGEVGAIGYKSILDTMRQPEEVE